MATSRLKPVEDVMQKRGPGRPRSNPTYESTPAATKPRGKPGPKPKSKIADGFKASTDLFTVVQDFVTSARNLMKAFR